MAAPASPTPHGSLDELTLDDVVFELDFHPREDVVATGLVTGSVFLHRYSFEGHKQMMRLKVHTEACRGVLFSGNGEKLYTGGADHKVAAIDRTGRVSWTTKADNPVNSLCNITDGILATGDDEGTIQEAAVQWKDHTDFISSIDAVPSHMLATSGDGTLSA
ncbi:unnamed protein product, partial [Phaeothamnion confervicola]